MADQTYTGSLLRGAASSEFGMMDFLVRRILGRSSTNSLVLVKAVHPGDAGGTVDIQPMVNQIDGTGKATAHGIIYNVPYFRLQGGTCAIIIDPVAGDIGLAAIVSEDISAAKVNRAPSNPGTRRRFNLADALYLGGFLNGTPAQSIQLDPSGGITITSASGLPVNINAPGGANITAPTTTFNGDAHFTGDITTGAGSKFNGKSFDDHTHGGVAAGSDTSGPPT